MSGEGRPPTRYPPPSRSADDGFDRWVDRQLQELFDEVAAEPVPDRLRRLVDHLEAGKVDDERDDDDPDASERGRGEERG